MTLTLLAILVNWNGKPFLQNSVSTVLAELAKHNGELLVVDNASSDGSVEFLQTHFPTVKILQTGDNLGGSGGFSAGMKAALAGDYQYTWLLDNDIIVEENALAPLLEVLQSDAKIGAAGSQICLYDKADTVQEIGGTLSPWLGALRQYGSGGRRLPPDTPPVAADYLAACSVLIKRECLAAVGVFGDFFIFYDDVEWGLRAKQLGWMLCAVPASVIRHNYNAIKATVAWREYYRKRNRLAVIQAYPPLYGGKLTTLIYLGFVNYSLYLHQWRNNPALALALRAARDDAVNGRLGKRDLAFLNEPTSLMPLNIPDKAVHLLVDIGSGAGNVLAAIQQLNQRHRQFYLPLKQQAYLNYFDLKNVQLANAAQRYDAIILGEAFHVSSLFFSGQFYSLSCRHALAPLKWPWLYVFNDVGKRIAALTIAVLISPWQWLRLNWLRHLG